MVHYYNVTSALHFCRTCEHAETINLLTRRVNILYKTMQHVIGQINTRTRGRSSYGTKAMDWVDQSGPHAIQNFPMMNYITSITVAVASVRGLIDREQTGPGNHNEKKSETVEVCVCDWQCDKLS